MNILPRVRIAIDGIMPERALLRLKRAGICLYNIQKPQKNRILFTVKKKDCEKVFAIYPSVCYNNNGYTPYTAKKIGAFGLAKVSERLKNRVGLLLGILLFCTATLYADAFVFGVEFIGSEIYAREVYTALKEQGITPFARYPKGKEDLVCAKLLSLDRVEFCSVKKQGLRVQVEMRLTEFSKPIKQSGDMQAKHTGKLVSITALKGTPLKSVGEQVTIGEPLVGAYLQTDSGKREKVLAIARASIACVYETEVVATDSDEAFAIAYLSAEITETDSAVTKQVEQRANGYFVRIEYIANESFNI